MFKCFDCTCERCKDPTEFGTYVGAISCTHCRNDKISSTDPLNNLANWKCNSCGYEIAAKTIISGNKDLIREISNLNKSSPKEFEMFLLKYADTLHATNTHVLQIKYALTQLYGNVPGFFLHELNEAGLARKIQLCHDLIDVADILEPGYSSFRGNLLLDLQSVMAVQTKREFHKGLITKQAAQENLMQAMQYLQEAVNILKIDPAMESILEERVTKLSQEMNID